MWVLKVDINLLNQHCKPANWLGDWLRYFDSQGTQGSRPVGHQRHSRHSGTWRALGHSRYSRHSNNTRALGRSMNLGTWALRTLKALGHSKGTWVLGHSRHLGTQALGDSKGTWALEAVHLGESLEATNE